MDGRSVGSWNAAIGSEQVEWADDRVGDLFDERTVDGIAERLIVSEQFLNSAEVAAVVEQVNGEGVSKDLGRDGFLDAGEDSGGSEGALEVIFGLVMSGPIVRIGSEAWVSGREEP